jgi:hypothetical protein
VWPLNEFQEENREEMGEQSEGKESWRSSDHLGSVEGGVTQDFFRIC